MGKRFIEMQAEKESVLMSIAMNEAEQEIIDQLTCVLHDPEIMGKDTFGRARIEKIIHAIAKRGEYYQKAFADGVEADYYQEKLDDELREVWGSDLVPFRERHPAIKIPGYKKAKKGWV